MVDVYGVPIAQKMYQKIEKQRRVMLKQPDILVEKKRNIMVENFLNVYKKVV